MYHDTQGRIWLSRLTRWQLVEEGEPPALAIANTEFLAAMEYRYDAARQRYMVRPRKPDDLLPYNDGQGGWLLDNGSWHEYTGQSIYGDYAVDFDETTDEAEVTETFAHAPGMAQYDYAQPAGSRRQSLRGNLVGTTERMVGESGVVTQRSVYTAFGELAYQAGVGQTRYGYCGAWGYEAATGVSGYADPLAELGWLHVGERYYDPASGRFMQRDPIGIEGGSNVYTYVHCSPVNAVDPYGLWVVIFQWRERGLNPGHTVAFSTKTGRYVSFGPWSNKGRQHDFTDDLRKYGGPCGSQPKMWILGGLDENAFSNQAQKYLGRGWDLGFNNCIHAVVECLQAGGATPGPLFKNPWEARKYFDKLQGQQ